MPAVVTMAARMDAATWRRGLALPLADKGERMTAERPNSPTKKGRDT